MQHRAPSLASVAHANRVLAEFRFRAGVATPRGPAAGSRWPDPAPPTSAPAPSWDPIGVALAASSLAVPAAGAFVSTEHVAAGVVLVVLAWVPVVACCGDQLQAMRNAPARRDKRIRIAAGPAPEVRGALGGDPSSLVRTVSTRRGSTRHPTADEEGSRCGPFRSPASGESSKAADLTRDEPRWDQFTQIVARAQAERDVAN